MPTPSYDERRGNDAPRSDDDAHAHVIAHVIATEFAGGNGKDGERWGNGEKSGTGGAGLRAMPTPSQRQVTMSCVGVTHHAATTTPMLIPLPISLPQSLQGEMVKMGKGGKMEARWKRAGLDCQQCEHLANAKPTPSYDERDAPRSDDDAHAKAIATEFAKL